VLLPFVVIAVWENVDAARQTTFKEANALAGVYWVSRSMPLPLGAAIEHDTLAYAHTVETTEWPLMAGHRSSPQATREVYAIRNAVNSFQPSNEGRAGPLRARGSPMWRNWPPSAGSG